VSTTPASIRIRPAIRTTSPPVKADPKLVETNLLTLCTEPVSAPALNCL
jgi:hypothetical protein